VYEALSLLVAGLLTAGLLTERDVLMTVRRPATIEALLRFYY
jgi:hypothetical protein